MAEEVDHRGEELPALSKRSSKVDLGRIQKFHKPDFTDSKLQHPFIFKVFKTILTYGRNHTLGSLEYRGVSNIPSADQGVLAVSWHTAGLIDPAVIMTHIDRSYAFAGRQDILTGPIIGWWGRRLGVQPLLRQAERMRGHADDDTAKRVNSASLLTVASKLAHGQASILMPEGHSHSEWHIIRLRTGPIRSALNAAAIASEMGNERAVILPVGITFRDPHSWGKDTLVEYLEPLELPILPDRDHGKNLLAGDWIEPDYETTLNVRDQLSGRLGIAVPDAPDKETWDAWLLLSNIESRGKNMSWGDEVVGARRIRDRLRGHVNTTFHGPEGSGEEDPASNSDMTQQARTVMHEISKHGLDQRAVHKKSLSLAILMSIIISPILLSTPITMLGSLLGNGPHCFVGYLLSKFNGEAPDKKTSFHLVSTMLGTIYVRPFLHLVVLFATVKTGVAPDLFEFASTSYTLANYTLLYILLWLVTDISHFLLVRIQIPLARNLSRLCRTAYTQRKKSWQPLEKRIIEIRFLLDALK